MSSESVKAYRSYNHGTPILWVLWKGKWRHAYDYDSRPIIYEGPKWQDMIFGFFDAKMERSETRPIMVTCPKTAAEEKPSLQPVKVEARGDNAYALVLEGKVIAGIRTFQFESVQMYEFYTFGTLAVVTNNMQRKDRLHGSLLTKLEELAKNLGFKAET